MHLHVFIWPAQCVAGRHCVKAVKVNPGSTFSPGDPAFFVEVSTLEPLIEMNEGGFFFSFFDTMLLLV